MIAAEYLMDDGEHMLNPGGNKTAFTVTVGFPSSRHFCSPKVSQTL